MARKTKIKTKLSNVLAASTAVFPNVSIPGTEVDINIFELPFESNQFLLETIIKEHCPSYNVFSNSSTPIATISDKDFKRAFMSSSEIMTDYATKRKISPCDSYQEITTYIEQHRLLVQPTGFAKVFNVASNSFVLGSSAVQTLWTTASAQVSGLSGSALIASSPIMVVTVPTLFGVGLSYCECLTRGTFLSPVCHLGARACLIPLKISEIVVNNVILSLPNKLIATPLIVNASDTLLNGFGLDDKLAASLIAKAQASGPNLKDKIRNWLLKKL